MGERSETRRHYSPGGSAVVVGTSYLVDLSVNKMLARDNPHISVLIPVFVITNASTPHSEALQAFQ